MSELPTDLYYLIEDEWGQTGTEAAQATLKWVDGILDKLLSQTRGGIYSSVGGAVRNAVADIRAELRGEGRL